MAFSCANLLKRLREPDKNDASDKSSFNLNKSPVDKNIVTDVSLEALDTLNSILSTVCSLNSDKLRTDIGFNNECVSQINLKDKSDIFILNRECKNVVDNCVNENEDCQIIENSIGSVNVADKDENEDCQIIENSIGSANIADNNENEDCQIIENSISIENAAGNSESEDCLLYDDTLNFKSIPIQITGAWSEFTSQTENNYLRGCKWAPDGSCILTCSADNVLRIFNLPVELWDFSKWQDISEMSSVLKISEGELVYDFCWYPLMNSNAPATCCFASCSRNSTVHLWDAFTGDLRCSYRAYDQMDEITAARSLSFDSDGGRIFCGFEKMVRIFNTDLPGRSCEERPTFVKKSGQSGIISCFAFSPTNKNISAAGSYSRTIGIYSEPDGALQCILEGQKKGLTHLQFSPDGNLLYSGGRKDNEILCWDLRNLGEVLFCLKRSCSTNQRMYFDISRNGRYLVSGNSNGVISVWDTSKDVNTEISESFYVLPPAQFFLAHDDCVNGISLNPSFPLLCSASGQRKFPSLLPDDDDGMFASKSTEKVDNSLRLWWIGNSS